MQVSAQDRRQSAAATTNTLHLGSGSYITGTGNSYMILSDINAVVNDGSILLSNTGNTFFVTGSSDITQSGTGISQLNNLTNNTSGTFTLSGTVSVYNKLSLAAGTLSSGGFLTMKSLSTNTAVLLPVTSGAITGDVTVERFISSQNNKAYRLLAPSVSTATSAKPFIRDNWQEGVNNPNSSTDLNPNPGYGTQITGSPAGANGFDASPSGQISLYTYRNTPAAWMPAINTDATTLDAKTGYLLYLRGDRSIDLTSASQTTNTTIRASGSLLVGTQIYTGLADNNFSLVSNPYASAINWSTIYANNSTSFVNFYTYWDPNIGTRGGYVTVTDGGVVNPSVSGGAAQGTVNIQSGQGFFVKSTTVSPTLTIRESDKSTTNNIDVFRTSTPASEIFTTSLYFNDPTLGRRLADGVTALYDATYNAGIDDNDAEEINNWDENIAIARGGKHLSIEERPTITLTDTLPLFMNNMRQMAYEFQFVATSFNHPGMIAQLVDKFTGGRTPVSLTTTTVIPFTITSDPASSATDRFSILFINPVALPVTLTSVKAYQKNAGVQVEWTTQQESNMDRYEVERSQDGQQFTSIGSVKAKGNSNVVLNYSFFDANPFSGVNFYRIRSVDINGKASYSVIVTVNISGGSGSRVTVYPNPVHNNTLILQLSNLEKGSYTISLTNKLGQQILSKVIDHPGGSATQSIDLSKTMSAGAYQVRITGNGISITQQVIKN